MFQIRLAFRCLLLWLLLAAAGTVAAAQPPVYVGLDAELAHAYDLTHILARAIDRAGSTDRAAVRAALEQVRNYDGLIKHYPQPFTPTRHEALSPQEVFMARYASDGSIVRISDR